MAFFDKMGETISSKSKDLAKKAKDMAEISSLNGQISSQEELINRTYLEMGKMYYDTNKEAPDANYAEKCITITTALERCEQLKKDIQMIKGTKTCESCGGVIGVDSVFCPGCGAQVVNVVAAPQIESSVEQFKTCTNCGCKVSPGSEFCVECGTKLS